MLTNGVEKREPLHTIGGDVDQWNLYGTHYGGSKKYNNNMT
jgi:hypothetical protein